jgi:hypothetical protein
MADILAVFALHHERHMKLRARIVETPFLTDVCSLCRRPI